MEWDMIEGEDEDRGDYRLAQLAETELEMRDVLLQSVQFYREKIGGATGFLDDIDPFLLNLYGLSVLERAVKLHSELLGAVDKLHSGIVSGSMVD